MALEIPKMLMNILHRWSRQLVSTWRSSRGWCLPPRPPPLPRAPLSFQAWSACPGGTSQHHQLIRCLKFLVGTSQHHKLIRCLPFWEGQVNLNCNLYLIMVCALIQLCMLAIPSIIPFGEKRSWRVCICKSFWGAKKRLSISPGYRRRQWLAFCFSSEASWRIFDPLERLFSCKIPVVDI